MWPVEGKLANSSFRLLLTLHVSFLCSSTLRPLLPLPLPSHQVHLHSHHRPQTYSRSVTHIPLGLLPYLSTLTKHSSSPPTSTFLSITTTHLRLLAGWLVLTNPSFLICLYPGNTPTQQTRNIRRYYFPCVDLVFEKLSVLFFASSVYKSAFQTYLSSTLSMYYLPDPF